MIGKQGVQVAKLGSASWRITVTLAFLSMIVTTEALPANADSFDYPNFISTSGLVLDGRAKQGKPVGPETTTVLRLMDGLGGINGQGSAWYGQAVTVEQGFTTTFRININTCVGTCGDGMAFVIQNATGGTGAIGGGGGSLGYGPVGSGTSGGIDHSLAIEFDTYYNSNLGDPNNNHAGVQSCGIMPNLSDHNSTCDLALNGSLPITLSDGATHRVTITYVPGSLTTEIDGQVVLTAAVDLSSLLGLSPSGTAFVGFTAGAGGAGENADVLDWTFSTGASLVPASLRFGTQALGVLSASKISSLINASTQTLTISSVVVSGNFLEGNTCGASLAPGASCAIDVAFQPRSLGPQSGTVTVTDSSPNSPQIVSLAGTGVAVELSPRSLTFGDQLVGTTSPPQTITLTNKGTRTLDIYRIGVAGGDFGDFNVDYTSCGASLQVEQSCVIDVTFTPQVTGTRSSSVMIKDSARGSPQTVPVTGTGT